jgi:hypothetical protein
MRKKKKIFLTGFGRRVRFYIFDHQTEYTFMQVTLAFEAKDQKRQEEK